MLTIIHGDDIVSSRKFFLEQKSKNPDAILLEGEKLNLTDLAQVFEGGGLFTETKTVFIEQFLSKKGRGKKSTEFAGIISYLEKQSDEHTIFIWEGKELEKSSLSTFKKSEARTFKLPQTLFLFLDSIKPDNGKQLISLFHKTIENTEEEMVFFMMIRQARLMLALTPNDFLKSSSGDPIGRPRSLQDDGNIDEVKRMAPWQKDKLQRQAKLFKKDQLIRLYGDLFKLEIGQKTGNLVAPLSSSIDFLLLEI